MTIFELLQAEHERALWLIQRARAPRAPEPGTHPHAPLDDLAQLLRQHIHISAALLYDALDRAPQSRQRLGALRERHVRMLRQVETLRKAGCRARDRRWRAGLDRLQRALAVHTRSEQALRPLARERVGDARLEKMFYEAEREKNHQSLLDSLIFPADRFGMR
jgi:hypothetical protein